MRAIRSQRTQRWRYGALALIAALLQGCAAHRSKAPETAAAVESERYVAAGPCDPCVREADYLAQRGNYLSALVTLAQVPRKGTPLNRLPDEFLEREGDYALAFGLRDDAEQRYTAVLDHLGAPALAARTRLRLAEYDYEHRDTAAASLKAAQQTLATMHEPVPAAVRGAWQSLYARSLMREQRYAEALAVLPAGDEEALRDSPFTLYNLGIARLNSGQRDSGMQALERLGSIETGEPDLQALRDKANLVVAYDELRHEDATRAIRAFRRVRLKGPYSNRALLGLGWAYIAQSATTKTPEAERQGLQHALLPWTQLLQRDTMDPAVQEALLALPYSLDRLGAHADAEHGYEQAITALNTTRGHLDAAIAAVRKGQLLAEMTDADLQTESGWTWQLKNLPGLNEAFYLSNLLGEHRFQQALKDYRDARLLNQHLDDWQKRLQALPADAAAALPAERRPETLLTRIAALRPQTQTAATAAQTRVETLAIDELQAQKQLAERYVVAARLALGRLYDLRDSPVHRETP